jgi:hypothetical protein
LTCHQQPDADTMRAIVERRPIDQKLTRELTHLNHKQTAPPELSSNMDVRIQVGPRRKGKKHANVTVELVGAF